MKTVTKTEVKPSWSHFIGLKRLWANIFGTATSFRSRSVRFQRKTLVWYFGEVLDPHIRKNTTVYGMKWMKLEYWCLEGYEVYFSGYCKSSSVHFGTHDLTKQLYASLHIFDWKTEDLKTPLFRSSLLSSHLTDSNSHISWKWVQDFIKPSKHRGMFQISNFCDYYVKF